MAFNKKIKLIQVSLRRLKASCKNIKVSSTHQLPCPSIMRGGVFFWLYFRHNNLMNILQNILCPPKGGHLSFKAAPSGAVSYYIKKYPRGTVPMGYFQSRLRCQAQLPFNRFLRLIRAILVVNVYFRGVSSSCGRFLRQRHVRLRLL